MTVISFIIVSLNGLELKHVTKYWKNSENKVSNYVILISSVFSLVFWKTLVEAEAGFDKIENEFKRKRVAYTENFVYECLGDGPYCILWKNRGKKLYLWKITRGYIWHVCCFSFVSQIIWRYLLLMTKKPARNVKFIDTCTQ